VCSFRLSPDGWSVLALCRNTPLTHCSPPLPPPPSLPTSYSLEDSDGFTRHNFNAIITNFTLQDTYWPHFKQSIQQGGALGVMCS
jgi:hypothetical protein